MKIFFVNAVCGTGSTGRIITDLCDILKSQGHQVRIAYGVGNASRVDADEAVKISNQADYYAHNVLSRITDRAGFYSQPATWKLIDEIRKFHPDLIHLHNLHGYYVNIKLLFHFLAQADIPVVWTLHDCWTMTGHCSHFSYARCEKWKTGCGGCQHLNIYPKSWGMDQSSRNFRQKKELFTSVRNMTIVTPSEWLAEIAKASFLGCYPVYPIPNGIDLDVFKPTAGNVREKYGIGARKIILAVANVWSDKKGYSDLCRLSRMLDQQTAQLVMAGLTAEQAGQVPDSILPICRTANTEELAALYTAADVFVNPSYEETMGMVTVEAMACGTPAVVYDRTAVPEVVDEKSGIVVPAGDIEGMYEAIYQADHFKAENIMERAEKYGKVKQYSRYLALYSQY